MTYTPQPGTIAHRVIAHLQTLGPDVELTSQVLLEAIGQPSDWHGLSTCMESAVFHGLVVKRLEGRRSMWRIAGERSSPGVDLDRLHASGMVTGSGVAPSKPQAARVVAVASMQPGDHVTVTGLKDPANLPQAPTCTESQTDAGCEFALTNSGRLLIDTGDQQMALTKEQADELMQYLDRARGLEWEGA